jgi:hypothetical protein
MRTYYYCYCYLQDVCVLLKGQFHKIVSQIVSHWFFHPPTVPSVGAGAVTRCGSGSCSDGSGSGSTNGIKHDYELKHDTK